MRQLSGRMQHLLMLSGTTQYPTGQIEMIVPSPSESVHANAAPVSRRLDLLSGPGMLVFSAVLLVLHQAYFWGYTVDDAFISYRYAENFATGHGLVFNTGEKVEGYSNFLWVMILAALYTAGLETVALSKYLGAFIAHGVLVATYVYAGRLGTDGRYRGVPALLLASTPSFAVWSVAGLETALFSLLVLGGLLRFMHELNSDSRIPWSALLMTFAAMTRPDGALLLVLAGFVTLLCVARKRLPMRYAASWFAVALTLGLAYMAWRYAYFGHLLPNTFYVKSGRGMIQYLAGVNYTSAGIRKHGGIILFVVALIPLIAPSERLRKLRLLAVFILLWMLYNVYKGHDVLPLFRFFVPMMPVVYLLAVAVVSPLVHVTGARDSRGSRAWTWGLGVAIAGLLATNATVSILSQQYHPELKEYQVQLRINAKGFDHQALALLDIAPTNASIALIDAGAISYRTGWYVVDRWGLVDEHIAHSAAKGPLGEKFDEEYVLSKAPTFIQTHVTAAMEQAGRTRGGWAGDSELFGHPTFKRDYRRLTKPPLTTYFVRRDAVLRVD
jgi:arabinofuranosyltransferase